MSVGKAEAGKPRREPGWWLMLPFDILGRVAGVVISVSLWLTVGLFVCTLIAVRALLWTSGKNLVLGFMGRPAVPLTTFNHWMLLWPRQLIMFIRWGFGYVDDEPLAARSPWELVQETFAVSFFFVSLIWANEVKPGYLPDVIAFWWWVWRHFVNTFGAGTKILLGLLGYQG